MLDGGLKGGFPSRKAKDVGGEHQSPNERLNGVGTHAVGRVGGVGGEEGDTPRIDHFELA